MRLQGRLALAALLGLQAWLGLSFIRSAAPTYDEAVHLASGYSYLRTGRYRLNIMDHPPLAEMWAALPLLPLGPAWPSSHPDCMANRPYRCSDFFLYQNRVSAERMLDTARVFALLTLGGLLSFSLLRWAWALGGWPTALAAATASAFCPVLLSNIALVTTDGLSAALFFLVFWLLSSEKRSLKRWALAGACAGLALGSKFNMILLVPLAGACIVLEHLLRPKPRPRLPWAGMLAAAAAAVLSLALVYRFSQLPLYFDGLSATLARLDRGRSTFLHGGYSNQGFLLYFPLALALKTPLPTLLCALGAAVSWLKGPRRERVWILVPMVGYFLAALASKTQIGVRHLLPMMPFLLLAAACGAAALWTRSRAAVLALGLWLAASALRVHPHQLAYFNELIGGPAHAHAWFVDSTLDWGQDLKTLGQELAAMGAPPIYLSYFGCADPAAYGIRYVPLPTYTNVDRAVADAPDPAASGRVLLAVSATNLEANYFADRELFAWLKQRKPLKVLGYSMFLYDLTEDEEARGRLARLADASGFPAQAKNLVRLSKPPARG
ncbi:MAG: glycosyltransferase family 39 protein [Elusimicrobiota bacterium]